MNTYLEFEEILNMEPYTKDGLMRRDAAGEDGEMYDIPSRLFG